MIKLRLILLSLNFSPVLFFPFLSSLLIFSTQTWAKSIITVPIYKLRKNINRLPVFYTFFKNTQFLHFLARIHLKLHLFSLFHFRLESVKKTNGNLKKWPFYPQNENYNFTLKIIKIIKNNQIKSNNFPHRSIKKLIPQPSNASFFKKYVGN